MAKKMFIRALFGALLFLSSEAFALTAQGGTDKVSASLYTNYETIAAGKDIEVLVRLDMFNGWHTYWINPGDAGLETQIKWRLPEGFEETSVEYSVPQKFLFEEMVQYGLGDVAYLKTKVITPKTEKNALQKFSATISWLACKDVCVPESVRLDFALPSSSEAKIAPDWAQESAMAQKVFPLKPQWHALYEVKGDKLLLNIDAQEFDFSDKVTQILFIPHQRDKISNVEEQKIGFDGIGKLSAEILLEDNEIDALSGVLLLIGENNSRAFELKFSKGQNLEIYDQINYDEFGLLMIMLMAFAGGLILNLMPCIFPILTIKVIALAQGSYNRYKARIESLLYFLGVVFSFFLIASILIWLRSKGEQIGWGFQLQSPIFVGIMIVIFSIIFLMLLDIVNLKNPFANKVGRISFKRQKINAFMTGFFAVLIASPCTGPFMGIAIGYTLSKPIYVYYPVFLALSVGYALPFVLAGLFPKFIHKFLPKPGKWMDILKKIFSIPVLLTVVWLFWVLFNQVNDRKGLQPSNILWQKYDAAKVEQLVEDGEKVFVDFTAKWCITCLANEKIALQSEEFEALVKKHRIQTFKADWTSKSADIALALASYGRNSIPLYVYYKDRNSEPVILPQLLTPQILKNYIK